MVKSGENELTKQDLEKTLEAHAKAIELQILISQQQQKLIEEINSCRESIKVIELHFTNGFRSDIKNHTHEQVQEVKEILKEVGGKLEKIEEMVPATEGNEERLKSIEKNVNDLKEGVDDLQGSSWKQWWLFGGIALFSIVNAVLTIVALWANGFVIGSGGK